MNDFIKTAYEQGVEAALEHFGLKEAAWSPNQEKALQTLTTQAQAGSFTNAQRQQLDYLRNMKRKYEMGQKGWKRTGQHYKEVAQSRLPAQGTGSVQNIPKIAPAVVPSVAPAVKEVATAVKEAPVAAKTAPSFLQRLKSVPRGAGIAAAGLGLGALGFGLGRADAPDATIGNTARHYLG